MDYKVVFTDNTPEKLDIEREILSDINAEVINGERSDEPVEELVRDADGIISSHFRATDEIMETMDACQVISRTGIGVDYIDLEAATKHGIIVTNVPDHCIGEVSDHALGFIVALHRYMLPHHKQVQDGGWDRTGFPTQRIQGQTLGLVAFGSIARALNKKAQALRMDVLAYDPYIDDDDIEAEGAKSVGLDTLAKESNVISLHAPLTNETEHTVDEEFLSKLQPGSFLINTSRGGLVDDYALADALENDVLAGAGLDVFEEEPLPEDHPLREQDNTILTPHVGYFSMQSKIELRHRCAENVRTVLSGDVPEHVVNPEVLD